MKEHEIVSIMTNELGWGCDGDTLIHDCGLKVQSPKLTRFINRETDGLLMWMHLPIGVGNFSTYFTIHIHREGEPEFIFRGNSETLSDMPLKRYLLALKMKGAINEMKIHFNKTKKNKLFKIGEYNE